MVLLVVLAFSTTTTRAFVAHHYGVRMTLFSTTQGGEPETAVLAVIAEETASRAARRTVAQTSLRRIEDTLNVKAKVEAMLRSAIGDARSALTSEVSAALEREAEVTDVITELKDRETAKRERVKTEKELISSLITVASSTPEATIAGRLAAVAEAKKEIILVDTALADEFATAIEKIDQDAQLAVSDRKFFQSALAELPSEDAQGQTIREFHWDNLATALDKIATSDLREAGAANYTRHLQDVVTTFAKQRDDAVDSVSKSSVDPSSLTTADGGDFDDDAPVAQRLKGAVKGVASFGAETAALVGDWVLSDKPEELAEGLTKRLRKTTAPPSRPPQLPFPTPPPAESPPNPEP